LITAKYIEEDTNDRSKIINLNNHTDTPVRKRMNCITRLFLSTTLTQEALAERVNFSTVFIGHVEAPNVKKTVSMATLFAIAEA